MSPIVWHCPHCKADLPSFFKAFPSRERELAKSTQKARKCHSCKREYTAGVSTCPHCKVATMVIHHTPYVSMSTKEPGDTGCNVCPVCHGEAEFCDACTPYPGCEEQKGRGEGTFSENRYPIEQFENGNIKVDGIEYAPKDRPRIAENTKWEGTEAGKAYQRSLDDEENKNQTFF